MNIWRLKDKWSQQEDKNSCESNESPNLWDCHQTYQKREDKKLWASELEQNYNILSTESLLTQNKMRHDCIPFNVWNIAAFSIFFFLVMEMTRSGNSHLLDYEFMVPDTLSNLNKARCKRVLIMLFIISVPLDIAVYTSAILHFWIVNSGKSLTFE